MVKPKKPAERSTTWLPFLRNHLDSSWAIDFFTVTTLTFNRLYVFVVLDHARRQVLHFWIPSHPSMKWGIQQLREAMPFGQQPRCLFRDNDGIYGHGVRAFLDSCDIKEVRTAYRSPWQNPFVERFIGTVRRELLDRVIVLSQAHPDRLPQEFLEQCYHVPRPHQGLDGDTSLAHEKPSVLDSHDQIITIPKLGGLHHKDLRTAA